MPGALLGPFGRYELGAEPVTIGRSSTNTLTIQDSQVSGRHLQVLLQGTEYVLVDVGSSNGTVFNGTRLPPQTPHVLRHGDIIIIGTTQLTVELTPTGFSATSQSTVAGPPPVLPSEQMGFAPAPIAPNFGPPAQPGAPLPPQFGPAAQPGAPPPNPFGAYPGNPPAQAPGYYPGPYGPPGPYQGAPGMGVGVPPTRPGGRRRFLLIGGVLGVLIILGASILTIFLLTHRGPSGPTIPDATTQVVTPFYESLKKQNYTTATNLLTAEYLQVLGGQQQAETVFQQFDTLRGDVTTYHIVSVKPLNGSATN